MEQNGFSVAENAEDLFHTLSDRNGLNLDRKGGLSHDVARALFLIALESRSLYSKGFKPGRGLKYGPKKFRSKIVRRLAKKHKLNDIMPFMSKLLTKHGVLSDKEIALALATRAICRSRCACTFIVAPITDRNSDALGPKISKLHW